MHARTTARATGPLLCSSAALAQDDASPQGVILTPDFPAEESSPNTGGAQTEIAG
jgi:hypothetical protein